MTMPADVFRLHRGEAPLLVSLPHDGTGLPEGFAARLTPSAARLPDTDWHIARLYAFAEALGASVIVPRHSRYVVDLNRAPDDSALYPGQNSTGLCPLEQFSGEPIYREGQALSADEVATRIETYWRPYHEALAGELDRLRARHGQVLLWEGHSIRGTLPFLFQGRLPDLNLGTADGASCTPSRQARVVAALADAGDYDHVVNGRFKGGYITRHYGAPAAGVDAVQLEISQRTYMDEATFAWDEARARQLQARLRDVLAAALG
jgi:N-formylglutamate deformylase